MDACFSQKRRKSKGSDAPFITHSSYFLPHAQVLAMEKEVERLRTRPSRNAKPLPVANTILDDCERSFTAAQSSKAKTSTSFFDDTGLMALICRHDCLLFLANIKSVGEKQYYVLALLEALFKELPLDWTVGVLYDIGCQIHRSCEKVRIFLDGMHI